MVSVFQKYSFKDLIKKLFAEYSYWLSFILLLILAVSVNTNFLRWSNIINIFVQTATTGIIALGMSMVISAGQIDISVGAQVAIISGLGIVVLNFTNSIWLMFAFCLLLGTLIGSLNGLMVAKGNMPAMIATLAMQSICRSLINQWGQGGPFTVSNTNFDTFRLVAAGSIRIFGFKIPYPMIMFIVFSILFGIIMRQTKLGKHIYAVGSNTNSARLAGVNVKGIQIIVFMITGLLCGFSGWLYASRVMAVAAASAGNAYEMEVIAAVAIGGTSMTGGRGKIIGTFLGALMFKIINNILTMADVPTFLNGAISGAIIIVAVLLQNVQNKSK
ncbi:ABC transporter permease [Flexilinea flocculi]|jgi:ribose transport system permease protein|uniref:Monosaccharide ABC transporter membrane protein, CUT2 family n=1 Tax=Flexilinea flocculi TaxID=1678840 RepID=A0A0S7BUY7_9CHLR|nr:ABC transporter permease [Flexilinea flocculi]NMB94948.1 ABC transporter permease [Flexilinea flocculi]GAP40159.1 monosaccharide ABC transporter membrane protein, CUT2 family [Flexilinea flocculi]